MTEQIPNGTRSIREGRDCVFFDGYWIRWYEPPEDTLDARKELIVQLTRRAFHHTEAGINTPGDRLEHARAAYEAQNEPAQKRVNAAMLAGALFNRATDIFTTIVDLTGKGVEIKPTNELVRRCGACFKEALKLGKRVRHYSGEEGIDELWGEPLKAFTMPIAAFYESRYIKIAQSMRAIDDIANGACAVLRQDPQFAPICDLLVRFADAARLEAETMKSDDAIFSVWPEFVADADKLRAFRPEAFEAPKSLVDEYRMSLLLGLITDATNLITYIAGARVPMPKSTKSFLAQCDRVRLQVFPKLANVS